MTQSNRAVDFNGAAVVHVPFVAQNVRGCNVYMVSNLKDYNLSVFNANWVYINALDLESNFLQGIAKKKNNGNLFYRGGLYRLFFTQLQHVLSF